MIQLGIGAVSAQGEGCVAGHQLAFGGLRIALPPSGRHRLWAGRASWWGLHRYYIVM